MTPQGDLGLLNDPVAQELLVSRNPARLAYTWMDGTPRVVPIWFHWNGREVVIGTPTGAPKLEALFQNPKVALTIDTSDWPAKVLLIRGTARVDVVEGVAPEYAAAVKRYLGEEQGQAFMQQAGPLMPRMARIVITPEWVGIIDFVQRFPSALESAMESGQNQAAS